MGKGELYYVEVENAKEKELDVKNFVKNRG